MEPKRSSQSCGEISTQRLYPNDKGQLYFIIVTREVSNCFQIVHNGSSSSMETVSVLLNLISIYHQFLTAVRSVMVAGTRGWCMRWPSQNFNFANVRFFLIYSNDNFRTWMNASICPCLDVDSILDQLRSIIFKRCNRSNVHFGNWCWFYTTKYFYLYGNLKFLK